MFSIEEVKTPNGTLQYRKDHLTAFSCRITSGRIKRGIDQPPLNTPIPAGCPFCPDLIERVTPTFPNGKRIIHGESVTFPNLFPFGEWHTVSTITKQHRVDTFTINQLIDAFMGQMESLLGHEGYPSINWNFLPSAGASIAHPHLQGIVDRLASMRINQFIEAGEKYIRHRGVCYWDDFRAAERCSERYLFGDEILWIANPVPIGEREVLGIFPISMLSDLPDHLLEFCNGLLSIIELYHSLGTYAFNMSIFFDKCGLNRGFRAFCSIIARINPNTLSLSDSSFMERLHFEPVILTSPEDLGRYYRKEKG